MNPRAAADRVQDGVAFARVPISPAGVKPASRPRVKGGEDEDGKD